MKVLLQSSVMAAAILLGLMAPLTVEGALLRGRVLDMEGRAVGGAKLFVYDSQNVRRPATFISPPSAADGSVVLTLPPGIYSVVARLKKDDSYGPLMPGEKHSGEPIVVDLSTEAELDQEFTVADIRDMGRRRRGVAADTFRLSGRIVDGEGKPVAGAYVFASTTAEGNRIPEHVSAWTGEDGTYFLFLPAGGKYYVGSSRHFPPACPWRSSAALPPDGGKTDLVLDLEMKPE